jgi:hypothetical protein
MRVAKAKSGKKKQEWNINALYAFNKFSVSVILK